MRTMLLVAAFVGLALSGCISDDVSPVGSESDAGDTRHDTVVVAVIDSGFNPYHFDMLAEHMPQHANDDPADDLPLQEDPATWLPRHPGAEAFASYDKVEITTTPDDPDQDTVDLYEGDAEEWEKVQTSSFGDAHVTWFPGTKVVGYVNFGGGDGFQGSSHGVGTSTVSVGNIHGACPNCLLVFVNGLGEEANRWVEQQDWIDVQTNSWGYSAGVAVRDRFYAGSDVVSQQEAVERGQAIFFSAGNGLGNTFTAPNPTLFSSQEGPDWIITVGAVSPSDGASYTGHGKPADVASVGNGYPSGGYGSDTTTTAEGGFGGTSNATPVTAGMYAEALYRLRVLASQGATQENGTIAAGLPACLEASPDCPAADGTLTYAELRDALLEAAEHTPTGYTASIAEVPVPGTQNEAEATYMAEGHGTYFGRLHGDEAWDAEVQRIVDHVLGARTPDVDEDLRAWSAALSFCSQVLWGTWDLGHGSVDVPASDPSWPVRSWFTDQCPIQGPAIMQANHLVTAAHPLYG